MMTNGNSVIVTIATNAAFDTANGGYFRNDGWVIQAGNTVENAQPLYLPFLFPIPPADPPVVAEPLPADIGGDRAIRLSE